MAIAFDQFPRLSTARPANQAHLLLWDTPTESDLSQLAFFNNAQRINYRDDLLARIDPGDRFLTLHHYPERELEAIKMICTRAQKPMVLLEGLDCLITYLRTQPQGHVTLFWSTLEKTRKLDALLWILLPIQLAPPSWPSDRLHTLAAV